MVTITTMTWDSAEDQMLPEFHEARKQYVLEQSHLMTTDKIPQIVSSTITRRKWINQEAANAWKDFVLNEAKKYNVSVKIDITEEEN